MNRFRLFFVPMKDSEDKLVTTLLGKCLDSGISNVSFSHESYWVDINFNNKIKARFWNRNKWYAWLCEGEFHDKDKDDKLIYEYHYRRPSKKVMLRLDKEIVKFFRNKLKNY